MLAWYPGCRRPVVVSIWLSLFLGSFAFSADEGARSTVFDPSAERSAASAERSARASEKAVENAATAIDEAAQADVKATTASDKATEASTEATKASAVAAQAAKDAAQAAEKAATAAEKVSQTVSNLEVNQSSTEVSSASHRLVRTIGGYVSLWGDPFPATLGVNLAYNVYDWARVNVGIGSDSPDTFRTTTAGLGIKFMVPKWPLTPVVGMNLSFTKSDSANPRAVRGFDPRGTHPYANAGLDWETGLGLNFAVGYNIPLQSHVSGSYYLNAGLFL